MCPVHFWGCNATAVVQVRTWDDLPENARKYVERVQELVGVECRWIGVGPGRDAIVEQPPWDASRNGKVLQAA